MKTRQSTKPLSSKTVEAMKPGHKDLADVGENRGLRVSCGPGGTKSFFYRYKSPETGKLVQMKLGNFPALSLAQARTDLQRFKSIRREGICPASEQKKRKIEAQRKRQSAQQKQSLTVEDLVELYLTQHIKDRKASNGKRVPGARKPKGQAETRRTLHGDAVAQLGSYPASEFTRTDVVRMVLAIVERGANVQAGNVLRELSAAYEFAIGLGKLPGDFANPAVLAKASLRQAKVKLTAQRGKRALRPGVDGLVELAAGVGLHANPEKRSEIHPLDRMPHWRGVQCGVERC